MPSKIVYIKRNLPFVHAQIKGAAAQEELSFARKSVGSYFASQFTTKKGTGLTEKEIELLLPDLIECSAKDEGFKKAVDKFYTEINTQVSAEGTRLEIGLTLNNDKPVTYSEKKGEVDVFNMPIKPEDYVRYKHATKHPRVGASPGSAKGNKTLWYYIEDPELVIQQTVSDADIKDEAIAVYMQIKDDPAKVKMVFTLLRHELPKPKEGEAILIYDLLDDRQILLQVREHLVMTKPRLFIGVATDEQLKRKYLVDELISVGLLKRIGTTIFVTESNEPLGTDLGEAAMTLWAPERSQLLTSFKTQYDELKRKQKEKQLVRS